MEDKQPLLKVNKINKTFGSLRANNDVDLNLNQGEIHALLGENGAGKSTLVKIICGVVKADSGTISWLDNEVKITSPNFARELGIGVVFQHFSLFRALTVVENIALGLPKRNLKELASEIEETSKRYGFPLDSHRPMHSLSIGEWQRVEIVRCLLSKPKLLILDEPTSVLTPQEADTLFKTLRQIANEGCAILYISHRLVEIKQLCHEATVMRGGEVVAKCNPVAESPESLAEKMIGHKPQPPEKKQQRQKSDNKLEIRNLNLPQSNSFAVALQNINLTVEAGAIVAIAGIAGNGQSEFAEVLSGERLVAAENIVSNGESIGNLSSTNRRKLGFHFVPEERYGHGAVAGLKLWENACLTSRRNKSIVRNQIIQKSAAKEFCKNIIRDYDVRCEGSSATAASLSGGNLQKFIIGREIIQQPLQLAIMQPTWGVDAGAAIRIHQALIDLAAQGAAVLIISQDLDEILTLADKVAVISDGSLSALEDAKSLTPMSIGLKMGAVTAKQVHAS